jgi:lysophospholipase L1-like esterase
MRTQSSVARQRWGQRRTAKVLLVLCGLLAGCVVAEIALRVVGFTYPIFYTTDAARGVALRPNMQGWYRREGESYVRINSEGLRDREHSKTKPPNTLRIAVLGDSYAEALQVPQENAFWAVMERRLNECSELDGKQVEVINFGVSGYGTAQELITLRERVWQYSPDIILLALTTNNDITDNSRALKKTDEIPYYVYRDNQLTLDASFRETPAFRLRDSALNKLGRWLRDSLRVVQAVHLAQHALKTYLATRRAQKSTSQTVATQPGQTPALQPEELGIDNLIYRPPDSPVWNDAWRVTEGLIVQMRDEVRSKGAKFLVVTLSNGVQVHPDASVRQSFMRRLGVNDLFYPDLRIKALGEHEEFAVLNLAPALQAYAEQQHVFLHGFGSNIGNGHWNQSGHQVAGEIIAQKLCEVVAQK